MSCAALAVEAGRAGWLVGVMVLEWARLLEAFG